MSDVRYEDMYDDDFDGHWIECHDCGGTGFLDDACECEAFEDICMCAEPTPPPCRECNGKGGWKSA